MKHHLTTTDGDSLCWEWTVRAFQFKYDCCFLCEKEGCHYRALFKNGPTCQPKLQNLLRKEKEEHINTKKVDRRKNRWLLFDWMGAPPSVTSFVYNHH